MGARRRLKLGTEDEGRGEGDRGCARRACGCAGLRGGPGSGVGADAHPRARTPLDDFETDVGGYHGSATAGGFGAAGYKWNQSITTSLGFRVFYAYYQTAANSGNGSFRFQETLWGPQFNTTYTF